MSRKIIAYTIAFAGSIIILGGCAKRDPNDYAMSVGKAPIIALDGGQTSSLALRQLQTRRFDTLDEPSMLQAAAQTLQDLGFTITESSSAAGVLVGRKQRDAVESGQVAGQVILAIVAAFLGGHHDPIYDQEQDILVTFATNPIQNSNQVETRVVFDRRLTNNKGQLWRTQIIKDASIYDAFFDKLSQSAFLEAHR